MAQTFLRVLALWGVECLEYQMAVSPSEVYIPLILPEFQLNWNSYDLQQGHTTTDSC